MDASARFIKVDTEKLRETAAHFGIRSIPTLVMIAEGKEIARQAGATDANSIVRWARSHMPGA
jgi:thioredoxin 2